jgi:Zn-dependent protease
VSNLALLLLAALGIRLGIAAGVFMAPNSIGWSQMVSPVTEGGIWAFAATFLSILFSLNLLLGTFNLLPVPPLDGRAIPLFFLRGRAVDAYLDFIRQPNFGMIGLLLSWQAFRWVYPPLRLMAIHLLYPGMVYG